MDAQLQEYINEWRKQRAKEENELLKLKEHQVKRKALRQQEEKRMAEKKKQEEARMKREAEEKKQKEQEEKLKRLEEIERRKQLTLQAQKASLAGKFSVSKSGGAVNLQTIPILDSDSKIGRASCRERV